MRDGTYTMFSGACNCVYVAEETVVFYKYRCS